MSFTDVEKSKLLFYLGYSMFEDNGPAMRALHSLDSKESTAGFIIRDLLVKLDDVRTHIHATIPLGKAIQDGSIQLRAHYTLDHLNKLGRIYVNELASFTKIVIASDIFSTGTVTRDGAEFYAGDPAERRFVPR